MQGENLSLKAPLPKKLSGKKNLPRPALLSKTGCALKRRASLPGGFGTAGCIVLFVGSKRTEICLLRRLGTADVSAEPSLPQGLLLKPGHTGHACKPARTASCEIFITGILSYLSGSVNGHSGQGKCKICPSEGSCTC